jgi:hypothetical protein
MLIPLCRRADRQVGKRDVVRQCVVQDGRQARVMISVTGTTGISGHLSRAWLWGRQDEAISS